MHVAVVGCGHGEVDKIYEVIGEIEKRQGIKVSVVLICGDFQTVRNMTDLRCMACPIKYQHMHDFYRYYSGEKKAPILTLFIGGNHEASNFLQELPYGGWVAPNIFYMGYVGVVKVGALRIAGISGIYKGHDYLKGRFEHPPYDRGTERSVYHYRNLDIFRLKQVKEHIDIVLSHDWPKGIHEYGDCNRLLRQKPFFQRDIAQNDLGSSPLWETLEILQPSYWFSAHLHVKFPAYVSHSSGSTSGVSAEMEKPPAASTTTMSSEDPHDDHDANKKEQEKTGNCDDDQDGATGKVGESVKEKVTKFLALDKVLPGRQFLQLIEIPSSSEESSGGEENIRFEYDPEWLAILKATNNLQSVKDRTCFMPKSDSSEFRASTEAVEEVRKLFENDFSIKNDFQKTAPDHIPGERPLTARVNENSHTKEFCSKLRIDDPIELIKASGVIPTGTFDLSFGHEDYPEEYRDQLDITMNRTGMSEDSLHYNPDEISIEDDEDDDASGGKQDLDNEASGSTRFRSKLVLPAPKNANDNNDTISPSPSAGPGFKRSSLILPPPKNDVGDGDGEDASVSISTSDHDHVPLFFLDTRGGGAVGEPGTKRLRND